MKKTILIIALTVMMTALCLITVGCGSSDIGNDTGDDQKTEQDIDDPVDSPEVTINAGTLVDRLYDGESKNTIVSGTSLNIALGLLGEGASSSTLEAIEKYIGSDMESFVAKYRKTCDYYANLEDGEILLANGLWVNSNQGAELKEEYEKKVTSDFDAEICQRDFSDGKTDDIINDWCKKHTKGLIDRIADESVRDNTIVGANALYFNCNWSEPFMKDFTQDEDFTLFDGTKKTVKMMNSGDEHIYLENDQATGFIKNYKSGLCFVGVLPKAEGDFNLTDIDLKSLIDTQVYDYEVSIKLPKFKTDDYNSLVDALTELGLGELFDPLGADLSNMATCSIPDSNLFVDSLVQKTYIDVNEVGTEAAAVTEFAVKATGLPPNQVERKEVFLNRPFAFAIYDSENDEFLFVGKIIDLE